MLGIYTIVEIRKESKENKTIKIKELMDILSKYDPEMDVKLSGTVYAGIDKYEWVCDMVEEDLEESDVNTHKDIINFSKNKENEQCQM